MTKTHTINMNYIMPDLNITSNSIEWKLKQELDTKSLKAHKASISKGRGSPIRKGNAFIV